MHPTDHRRFIRHPADVPIEFSTNPGVGVETGHSLDVSLGGLSFESECCPENGKLVEIRIPGVSPEFRTMGRVAWCRSLDGVFEVGVEFLKRTDAFRARMVEQVCHIEQYRREVEEREGRQLSGAEAAREWISKFAAGFPNPALEGAE